jgi:Protein of unknown function (DUF3301)
VTQAVALLIALGVALGTWYWSVAGRELVLAISREVCRDLKLQRLDDSVALRGLRIVRDSRLTVERRYEFEFSTDGADRRCGVVALRGSRLTWVKLDLPSGPLYVDISGQNTPT